MYLSAKCWTKNVSVYSTDFDKIIITFTDQNGRSLEVEEKVNCLFINRNDTLFYRTKNMKICQSI